MFDFKTLKLCSPEQDGSFSSFVGIRRNNKELEFRLPRGFSEFPSNNFDETKRLFFRMYSTFRKFERDNTSLKLDERAAGKDNISMQSNGYRFKDKESNDVILYSKITLIENLLEAYRDLALDVIERRIGQDEKVDYSKIEHYLHKAVYLPNDVIFIDEMDLTRQTLQYEAMKLIDLFCFILTELQAELEQETDTRVQELAHRFSEQHLSYDQSLFVEETFEITIQTLKNVLDDVDKRTVYKDDDYWRLYEAIELFLYGELEMEKPQENGIFWGINNFSSIWEDMCATYAFATFNVIYADTNIVFNGEYIANAKSAGYFPIFKKPDFNDLFFIEFRGKKRWMRPDLIHSGPLFNPRDHFFDECIQVVIKSNHSFRVNFEVKLLDKNYLSEYDTFLSKLERAKTPGKRKIGKNQFNNYPESELEKQKTILLNCLLPINNSFRLLDWKYMDVDCFTHCNQKVQMGITKQLCYEFSLQNLKPDTSTDSQFVIPWFYSEAKNLEEEIGDFVDDKTLHQRLRDNQIKVFKANFPKIQAVYLSHD